VVFIIDICLLMGANLFNSTVIEMYGDMFWIS